MNQLKWLGLGGLLATALLLAMNLQADDCLVTANGNDLFAACMTNVKKDCQTWAERGGGSDVPRGLTSDTKAELAIGERYILTGTILVTAGDPYLRIDFHEEPWLASQIRNRNPFYRINDLAENWKKYANQEITLIATAQYSAWADQAGRTLLEIYLVPADQPVLPGLQSRSNGY
jgi:hypothetical protein